MEPDEAEDLRRLLSYGELTAGGMMNPEPIMLLPDATVAEALARVRSPEVSPSLAAQVYVVRAPVGHPVGQVPGRRALPAAVARATLEVGLRGG